MSSPHSRRARARLYLSTLNDLGDLRSGPPVDPPALDDDAAARMALVLETRAEELARAGSDRVADLVASIAASVRESGHYDPAVVIEAARLMADEIDPH